MIRDRPNQPQPPTFGQCGVPFIVDDGTWIRKYCTRTCDYCRIGCATEPGGNHKTETKKKRFILLVPAATATATRIQFSLSRLAPPPLASAAADTCFPT